MTYVKVFRKGKEVGWFKDIIPGQNAIVATCKVHGFDITEYEFRDYETSKNILWKGEKKMLEAAKVV